MSAHAPCTNPENGTFRRHHELVQPSPVNRLETPTIVLCRKDGAAHVCIHGRCYYVRPTYALPQHRRLGGNIERPNCAYTGAKPPARGAAARSPRAATPRASGGGARDMCAARRAPPSPALRRACAPTRTVARRQPITHVVR